MKKKRKKVNRLQQQKLHQAQHKNEFLLRVQRLCCLLGEPHIYKTFPPYFIDMMYTLRSQAMRVNVLPGNQVQNDTVETAKVVFTRVSRNKKVAVLPDNSIEINLYDFTTVYETLMLMLNAEKYKNDPKLQPANTALQRYSDCFEQMYNQARTFLMNSFGILNIYASDLRQKLYLHDYRHMSELEGKSAMVSFCDISCTVPERRNFSIDGISRPAFRVGWAMYEPISGFDFIFLTPEQLHINMLTKDYRMPLFIQSHAIQRLLERLDDVHEGIVFIHLYHSIKSELSVIRDRNGTILVSMNIQKQRVGYLIADIIDRCVVLRTFLFLTQFGTPEGDKLKQMTGLNKIDCDYFEITRLSTFIESDIQKNEKLKNLFIQAGCESLFNINYVTISKKNAIKEKSCADQIIAYLGLDKEEEPEDTYEEFGEEMISVSMDDTISEKG